MTNGERKVADALAMVAMFILAMFALGIMLTTSLDAITWTLKSIDQWLGRPPRHVRFEDVAFWPTSLGLGAGLCVLFGGGWLLEALKAGKRRELVPAFIWPERSSENPTAVGRLGRVLHWTFATLAALALLAGLFAVFENESQIVEQTAAQRTWDRTHPIPDQPGFVMTRYQSPEGWTEYRPTVPEEDYLGLWLGLGAAAILLLMGRGCRYILANE